MTTALEIPSHARAQQSDSCAGYDPHCRSTLPCIFVNALRRLNPCMFKRRLSASKPAAEPQIAAASHGAGRRSWHTEPSTHPPGASLARKQLRICLPGRCSLPQAQTAIATAALFTSAIQRSSPLETDLSGMQFNMPLHYLC